MQALLRLASSVGDVVDLVLGEEYKSPATQVMEKYPYLFIR